MDEVYRRDRPDSTYMKNVRKGRLKLISKNGKQVGNKNSSLNKIYTKAPEDKIILAADIKGFFDNINHN